MRGLGIGCEVDDEAVLPRTGQGKALLGQVQHADARMLPALVAGPGGDPAALTARDRAAARAVRSVADELGIRPAQVAIAEVVLPDDAVRRLEAAVEFRLGFPGDFIAECESDPFVFGDVASSVDARRSHRAVGAGS